MAVTFTLELTEEQASGQALDEVRRVLGIRDDADMPPGMLAHLESDTAGGHRIVDVWESAEDFERFRSAGLGAAFDAAGVSPLSAPPAMEDVRSLLLRQRVARYEEVAQRIYDAFTRNDTAEIDACFTEDFVDHEEMPGVPGTREGVKQWLAMVHAAFADLTFTPLDVTGVPGRAAARMRMTGRHVGEFMGIPATGRQIEVEGVDYVTMDADGRCREHWGQMDMMGLMAQLGIPGQQPVIELPTEAPA